MKATRLQRHLPPAEGSNEVARRAGEPHCPDILTHTRMTNGPTPPRRLMLMPVLLWLLLSHSAGILCYNEASMTRTSRETGFRAELSAYITYPQQTLAARACCSAFWGSLIHRGQMRCCLKIWPKQGFFEETSETKLMLQR
ncbi:hypothetical protein IRJ41_009582 [Triplophysa rosa]|uniref:Uncharacterized protein n=1 Tax=Triplophysa rosa TaxID=992332 RepID=A0A9W7X4X2_TRIRA|nr:hypothetical protein IRJ41_009582 [Triplophysa rosa]